MCREWCEKNDLLSPIYTTATRGGCWFCHNQSVNQLRLLRQNYPEYWALMLKWDKDSPVTFHADGHTVHDFDRRFKLEELKIVPTDRKFRWDMCNQVNLFELMEEADNFQNAVQNANNARQERTEVTQDYVIWKLKEIADRDASDALSRGLKELGKELENDEEN